MVEGGTDILNGLNKRIKKGATHNDVKKFFKVPKNK